MQHFLTLKEVQFQVFMEHMMDCYWLETYVDLLVSREETTENTN